MKNDKFFQVMKQFRRLHISDILPNLSHQEFATLYMLQGASQFGDKIRVADVVDLVCASPPSVSRTLKSLEEKNLIQRTIDSKNRRITYVNLTKQGKETIQESGKIMDEFSAAVWEDMGKENMEQLIGYLEQLYEVSTKEINKRKTGKGSKKNEENI